MVRAAKDFVRIYVDCSKEKEKGPRAKLDAFNVTGFPSLVLLHPDGKTAKILAGSRKPEEYVAAFKAVLDALPERRLANSVAALGSLKADIQSRIDKLSDSDPEVRERAAAELRALKEALELALAAAAKSGDAEQAGRAKRILEKPKPEPVKVPVEP